MFVCNNYFHLKDIRLKALHSGRRKRSTSPRRRDRTFELAEREGMNMLVTSPWMGVKMFYKITEKSAEDDNKYS